MVAKLENRLKYVLDKNFKKAAIVVHNNTLYIQERKKIYWRWFGLGKGGREFLKGTKLVKLGQRNQDAWPMHHDNTQNHFI